MVVLSANQAFAASITVTSQPLQNTGTNGAITYSEDHSGASAIVNRHETSDLTLNVSDQATSVTVGGDKASGTPDVSVTLKDGAGATLDSGSGTLADATGAYSTAVTLTGGTTAYYKVATVSIAYTSTGCTNTTITLTATDGWDDKNSVTLVSAGQLSQVTTSDNTWYLQDTPYWTSFEFDQTVPGASSIVSVIISTEHWEDAGFKANELTWKVGGGTQSSPTILQTTLPTILNKVSSEAVVTWDVTTWIDTPTKANDLKFVVDNGSTTGKKTNVDHVFVDVTYCL